MYGVKEKLGGDLGASDLKLMNMNRFNTVNMTDSTVVESRELPNIKGSINNSVNVGQSVSIHKSLKVFNKNLKSINDNPFHNSFLTRKALNNSVGEVKQSKRNIDYYNYN